MIVFLLLVQLQDPAQLSQQGAQALRERRYPEAERVYRQLAKAEPANPAWRMNLGIALHSASRYREAVPEFEAFLKVRPTPGPVHLLLGLSRLKLTQPCEAIPSLEKARQWNAEQAVVELADAYYGCRRFAMAARTYEAALATKHQGPAVARQAGHCYWEARQYPEAKRLFFRVARQFAEEADFNFEYGDTLVRLDGPEAGLSYLEKAVAKQPDLLAARGELGKALQSLERAAEAIPHLELASKADPALLLPLSRAYRATGRTTEAEQMQAEYRKRITKP